MLLGSLAFSPNANDETTSPTATHDDCDTATRIVAVPQIDRAVLGDAHVFHSSASASSFHLTCQSPPWLIAVSHALRSRSSRAAQAERTRLGDSALRMTTSRSRYHVGLRESRNSSSPPIVCSMIV